MLRNFNSSTLVRLLGGTRPSGATTQQPDFAERISLWLGGFDAARLHDAHLSIRGMRSGMSCHATHARAQAMALALQQLCHGVAQAIAHSGAQVTTPGMTDAPRQADVRYAPYRQLYLDQQRQMVARIGALRVHVRQILGETSHRLRQLAALDAAMEQALGAREHSLLGKVPDFLEARFKALHQGHVQALTASGQMDDAAAWFQPGGWLQAWRQELKDVLLAELDVRLQPVSGLMDAFSNEIKKGQ